VKTIEGRRLRSSPYPRLVAAHEVRVDPERERQIGVPELIHHVRRVVAERDGQRRERVPQLVRRQA
jgi:hypothetical protein